MPIPLDYLTFKKNFTGLESCPSSRNSHTKNQRLMFGQAWFKRDQAQITSWTQPYLPLSPEHPAPKDRDRDQCDIVLG